MNFKIDRAKWLIPENSRGQYHDHPYSSAIDFFGQDTSMLLQERTRGDKVLSFMCCLGQIGEQCGVPREDLLDEKSPATFVPSHTAKLWWMFGFPHVTGARTALDITEPITDAMAINDEWYGPDKLADKERDLQAKMAELNITLEFVGEYLVGDARFVI